MAESSFSTPEMKPASSSEAALMRLKILLPSQVFLHQEGVARIVAHTDSGSVGLLPRRLDCVLRLMAGIMSYQVDGGSLTYLAVSDGILVKTGGDVRVSAHRVVGGVDLGKLQAAVRDEFSRYSERQEKVRAVMAKLESGVIRRLLELRHE